MQQMQLEAFKAAVLAQQVPPEHYAFVCPFCATIQSATDLIRAGAGRTFAEVETIVGVACVGHWTQAPPPPRSGDARGRGCNWTVRGRVRAHRLEVVDDDGVPHPRFAIATPTEAKRHMDAQRAA